MLVPSDRNPPLLCKLIYFSLFLGWNMFTIDTWAWVWNGRLCFGRSFYHPWRTPWQCYRANQQQSNAWCPWRWQRHLWTKNENWSVQSRPHGPEGMQKTFHHNSRRSCGKQLHPGKICFWNLPKIVLNLTICLKLFNLIKTYFKTSTLLTFTAQYACSKVMHNAKLIRSN